MMTAANDTALPTTLDIGTMQSATWRAVRSTGHIELTHLPNAGIRGRTCARLLVTSVHTGRDERLEGVAAFVFAAVQSETAPDVLAAALADVTLAGLEFKADAVNAFYVDREPAINVHSDLVHASFAGREMWASFTAMIGSARGAFRHDTGTHAASPKDAAKAYAWAKVNAERLPRMTLVDFRREMDLHGVRLS